MQTYRTETTIPADGTLTIKGLPFHAGDKVEVTVQSCDHEQKPRDLYPLRGKLLRYVDPFESVSEADWEVLN